MRLRSPRPRAKHVLGKRPALALSAVLPVPGRRRKRRGFALSLAFAALGLLAGVGMVFAFDPANRRRRALARDRAVHLATVNSKRARRAGRAVRKTTLAARRRWMHETPRERMGADDHTLEQRVQSTIFRDHREARGAVAVDVQEGVVSLRGQLDDARVIAALEREAARVPGVAGVLNLLHEPGTVAPNKAEAIEASQSFLHERVLPGSDGTARS